MGVEEVARALMHEHGLTGGAAMTGAQNLIGEDGCEDPILPMWHYMRPFDPVEEAS